MAELVDALDSKSSDFGRVGSIPTQGTISQNMVKLQASSKKELASFLEQSEVIYVLAFTRSVTGTFAEQMSPTYGLREFVFIFLES